jgi:thiol-disulfide isomerase/thioredoxin
MIHLKSLFIIFISLGLTSCGDTSTKRQRLSDVQRTGVETFVKGEEIPDTDSFIFKGETHSIRSLSSGGLVILNFWASWCVPCVKELPSLQELSERVRHSNVHIVTVNIDPEGARNYVKKLMSKINFELPVIWDPELVYVEKYRVSGFPETFFISDGKFDTFYDPVSAKTVVRIKGDREWSSTEMTDALTKKVEKSK